MIRPVTYYEVVCDEPGCGCSTADLGGEYAAFSDGGAAEDDWDNSGSIKTESGEHYCEEHKAAYQCCECYDNTNLIATPRGMVCKDCLEEGEGE
jgi:hypothetical protein